MQNRNTIGQYCSRGTKITKLISGDKEAQLLISDGWIACSNVSDIVPFSPFQWSNNSFTSALLEELIFLGFLRIYQMMSFLVLDSMGRDYALVCCNLHK